MTLARRSSHPFVLLAAGFAACAAPKPVVQSAVESSVPLERVCQELLPLPTRTIGALVSTLRAAYSTLTVHAEPCHAGTAWPIAYAVDEEEARAHPGKAPVGYSVLKMEGDALLTFDKKDRETPTVNLCQDLELILDAGHRLRAIGLWESSDEHAFDPAHLEQSTALLAYVSLLSRSPSACALGRKEDPGKSGDAQIAERLRCAAVPLVVTDRRGCDAPAANAGNSDDKPDAEAVERAARAVHRFALPGRTEAPGLWSGLDLRFERPELCLFEPPPAEHDVCLIEYLGPTGERWYARADVMRTGQGGAKNYVDSYLTIQLLRRLEAQRRSGKSPSTNP